MSIKSFLPVILMGAIVAAGCGDNKSASTTPGAQSSPNSGGLHIAVIPKGTTHAYWKSVEQGADQAGKEMGATITFKGPLKEDDRAQQISIVQQFVSDKMDGIVIAPLDEEALQRPAHDAMAQNIPVVVIDSALKGVVGKDYDSFVATNNLKGGMLGGQRLGQILGGKGKVVMLRYEAGSASTMDRETGFLTAIQKFPGITVISDNQEGGSTQSEAKTAALNMVDVLKQANGIFCPNESTTVGMLLALKQLNMVGKAKFVGFDTSDELIAALKANQIDALVAQNPIKMGYLGVKTCIEAIKKLPYEKNIDTGVMVVDAKNISSPEVVKLLGGG